MFTKTRHVLCVEQLFLVVRNQSYSVANLTHIIAH